MYTEVVFLAEAKAIINIIAAKNINVEACFIDNETNENHIVISNRHLPFVLQLLKAMGIVHETASVELVQFPPIPGQIAKHLNGTVKGLYTAENNRFVIRREEYQ